MRREIKDRIIYLVIGSGYANCSSADFRTIVGASTIYNVGNMVSDISLTTNDVAVGLLVQKATDVRLQESSIYYV